VILFIVKRLGWAVVLLLAITMVMYALFFLVPSTPGTTGRGTERESINLRESVEIDGPIYKEYGLFLWRIGHGSFGVSWVDDDRQVNEVLVAAMPVTLSLVAGGLIMWMLLAVPIGVLSALRPRSIGDRLATIFVLIGVSAHPVWLGLVLSYFLGYKARLFPVGGGYCDLVGVSYCGGFVQWFWHLVLPWTTFALLYAALYARMIRASVIETMDEDYVRTARAKGASGWLVLRSHVLRNAMLPVVTMLGMDAGYWMGNVLFVETVFGLPGVGRLLTTSLARRDLPILMAITVFVSLLIILLNLVVDLLYGAIDPRARVAGERREIREPATARAESGTVSSAQPA
jgi:peptide/nickel transport system permease protein